jgi:hypothetical protein
VPWREGFDYPMFPSHEETLITALINHLTLLFGRKKNEYCCTQMDKTSAVDVNDDLTEFWIYDEDDKEEFIRFCPFCGTDLKEEE